MERDTFIRSIRELVGFLGGCRRRPKERITDATIVQCYSLAVIDGRVQDWGGTRSHWPQRTSPRRYGPDKGMGRRRHAPARVRCRDLLENTVSEFGRDLHHERDMIERVFGTLTCTAGLLNGLPAWVRTYPRVHRWVQAKIALYHLRRLLKTSRLAA